MVIRKKSHRILLKSRCLNVSTELDKNTSSIMMHPDIEKHLFELWSRWAIISSGGQSTNSITMSSGTLRSTEYSSPNKSRTFGNCNSCRGIQITRNPRSYYSLSAVRHMNSKDPEKQSDKMLLYISDTSRKIN